MQGKIRESKRQGKQPAFLNGAIEVDKLFDYLANLQIQVTRKRKALKITNSVDNAYFRNTNI